MDYKFPTVWKKCQKTAGGIFWTHTVHTWRKHTPAVLVYCWFSQCSTTWYMSTFGTAHWISTSYMAQRRHCSGHV